MNFDIKETRGEDEGGKFVEVSATLGDQRVAKKTYNLDFRCVETVRRSIEATVLSIRHPNFDITEREIGYKDYFFLKPKGCVDDIPFVTERDAIRASHIIAKWMDAGPYQDTVLCSLTKKKTQLANSGCGPDWFQGFCQAMQIVEEARQQESG